MMFVALADLPYGYYQLLRLVTLACAVWIIVAAWHSDRQWLAVVFGLIALIFNPVIKL